MFISDFAIKRPVVTISAMLALVIFGIISLVSLETDEFPDVQQPVIGVTLVYPGASPLTVEREVLEPVEEAIFAISGVDGPQTSAIATDGLAQLTVVFDFEKDLQEASQDIRDAISGIRSDLPLDMEEPILTRFDPANEPVVSLSLTSQTLSATALSLLADPTITRELRSITGVAQVSVVGGVERALMIDLRPEALQAAGVSVGQVVAAVQAQNLAAPVGRISATQEERSIRLRGRLEGPEEFRRLVVASRGGQNIELGQLANVYDGVEEPRTAALFNGEGAVGIEVLKAKGYSTTQVADEVQQRVAALQQSLPAEAKLELVRNSGTRVRQAVRNVEEALLEGAVLTVLVVFLFLNSWRSTVITGLALPVSVLASFISVWAFGFTLNTMSLLGLSLAIGILIDDAIVVRENIVRHVEMGQGHFEAAHNGTNQIGLAVSATTFSIVAVFIPVAFMYGVAGQWFKPFALTIAVAVLVSLLVSFSLDPMLSAYWPDPQLEQGARRGRISRALVRFNAWFGRQAKNYQRLIGWALDHPWATLLIATFSFLGAVALQVSFGGAGFVPVSDRSEVSFILETPPGASLEYTKGKAAQISALARSHPEVAYTYTTIGVPIPLRAPGVDQALIYAKLKPKHERKLSQNELGELLRRETAQVGGVATSVFTSGFGGAFKAIQIELRGPDAQALDALAGQALTQVRAVPGVVDASLSARSPRTELEVLPNRPLAGALGISVADLGLAMRAAFAGIDVGDWVDPAGETRDVQVRLEPSARRRAADLRTLPILANPSGQDPRLVPLGQVATVQEGIAPAEIDHLNRERVISIQASLQDRSLSEVMEEIRPKMEALQLPPGFALSYGGEIRAQSEVFSRVFLALAVAVMLMYLILVVQFGSFLDPLPILGSLPLAFIGVVLALLITRDTLNVMSLIGLMLLMGIVAKNAILLIDFAKWSNQRGTPMREALIEAGRIRLRPILMTSFAIIAGMTPVALGFGEGGDFRAPLGRAVIGGVITSTLLTLLVIPTAYEILDRWRSRALELIRRMGRARRGEVGG